MRFTNGIRAFPTIVFFLTCSLVMAACSSSTHTSAASSAISGSKQSSVSTSLSSFKTALTAEEAVPHYLGPRSGPKPQPGKKITVIECAAENTGCVSGANSVKQAATAVGWTTTIVGGNGTPSSYSKEIVNAVDAGTQGIVLLAVPSQTILQGMQAAANAHIPVVSVVSGDPVGNAPGDVYANVGGQSVQAGKDLADYFIVASGGHAKVAAFHVPSLTSTVERYTGFIDEMKKCSGCQIVSNQTYGLVSQATFENQIEGVMNAHPDIQYIFVDISQYATIAADAIQHMGLVGKVGVAGIDCLPPEVQSIKDGTGEVACAEDATSLAGWATVNEMIRAFAGLPPLRQEYPLRLLTKQIIEHGTPPYLGGFTPAPYYLKLWGKN